MDIIASVLAIITAPLIALGIGAFYQDRRIKYDRKYAIFRVLMGERASWVTPAAVNALNLIDLEFKKYPEVLRSWSKYYGLVNSKSFAEMDGVEQLAESRRYKSQLLLDMVSAMRFRDKYTLEDFERGYFPQALGDPQLAARAIANTMRKGLETYGAFPIVVLPPPAPKQE